MDINWPIEEEFEIQRFFFYFCIEKTEDHLLCRRQSNPDCYTYFLQHFYLTVSASSRCAAEHCSNAEKLYPS